MDVEDSEKLLMRWISPITKRIEAFASETIIEVCGSFAFQEHTLFLSTKGDVGIVMIGKPLVVRGIMD